MPVSAPACRARGEVDMMFRHALHNLLQNKIRPVISMGGVALALTLILALDAIMTGVEDN